MVVLSPCIISYSVSAYHLSNHWLGLTHPVYLPKLTGQQFKLLLILANMQTKGSSLKKQWFCSFRDHYHKSVPILVASGKMSPSPHSARVLTDTTHVRGEGLGSLDVQIHPGRLKRGERQTTHRTRRMGFPQEEKSSPGTHSIMHIRAPKHGSHKHTQGAQSQNPWATQTL